MLNKALASNELCELETMGTGVDGRATYYLSRVKAITENGQTTGLIMIGQDMTHRRLYEERLQVSQKLESLGLLAGGIAHDFNNLMGGIFGYIDIAKEILGDQEISKYLAKALNTMERARNLTHQLLTFSKGGSPKQAIGPLFPFVQETVHFILTGADISCSFEHASDLWLCNFDTNQIGQVIDNLFINAKQAMPNGGNIRIRAENFENIGLQKPFLAPGKFAILSVHDSGSGISQNQIAKIFDPFFTTKDKGHGLGLATSYSIVKRHGGLIEVDSEVNKGSVFRVYLPAAHSAVVNEPELILTLHHGQGSILVMDDEIVMRETICDMLQLLGYESFAIENGEQVLDYLQASHTKNQPIVAMIIDLTIPGGMGGKAVVAEIRKRNLEIPIFVSSGYSADPVMVSPQEYGFTASLCKPFRKVDLGEILEKYLPRA